MQYGAILKALRVKSKMTQEQLAERLNRSRPCISKIENDSKTVDMPTFMQWVHATNCPEVAVAMMYGMDGLTIVNQLLPIIGGFIWWTF